MTDTPDLDKMRPGEKKQLLIAKYSQPNTPRYIKPDKFDEYYEGKLFAIDTTEWKMVMPEFINDEYTGKWIDAGDILYNDYLLDKLLKNTEPLEEAKLPTNGGRRRAQRKTKVKSKKRANKRRTRTRSRK